MKIITEVPQGEMSTASERAEIKSVNELLSMNLSPIIKDPISGIYRILMTYFLILRTQSVMRTDTEQSLSIV